MFIGFQEIQTRSTNQLEALAAAMASTAKGYRPSWTRRPNFRRSSFRMQRKANAHRACRTAGGSSAAQALWRHGACGFMVGGRLVRQGHKVTLFASGGSETTANLVVCAPRSLRLAGIRDHLGSTLRMLREVRQRADDFDIIHFNVDLLPNALFHDLAHKCLMTLHGRLDRPDILPLYEAYPEMPLVSISNAQRLPMPANANWLATIPHGLPLHVCPFDPEGGDYLAFLGRISPEKRPDRAIEIAKRAGVPLKIAAKVDVADLAYFKAEIEPLSIILSSSSWAKSTRDKSVNSLATRGRYCFQSTGRSPSGW